MRETADLWAYEREAREAREQGYTAVCGVDEAGAGPLMGPVYAAAVILPEDYDLPELNDSKKLTEKKREMLFPLIKERAIAWSVAWVEASEIDATDILSARMKAMQMAIDGLSVTSDMALIDGNRDKGHSAAISTAHRCIVGGDGKSADFTPLKRYLGGDRIRLYCFGRDGAELAELRPEVAVQTETMEQAMRQIAPLVKAGDMVLLSPACASLDQFKNFEQRGEMFARLAKELG